MATISAFGGGALPNTATISSAQTGTGPSTDVVDTGGSTAPALVRIVSTVGASPTVTVAIEGSSDAASWFAIPYSDIATPTTVSVATFAITTATTTRKYLPGGYAYRYIRLNYSANTNVTLTVDVFIY